MFTQRLTVQVEDNEQFDALQVRLQLAVLDVQGTVIATRNHRTAIPYEGGDVWQQMAAINTATAEMGWPSTTAAQVDFIKAHYDTAKRLR